MKEHYTQIGSHKLLARTVINLSPVEFEQLKLSTDSVASFLKFITNENAQCQIDPADEGQKHQTP